MKKTELDYINENKKSLFNQNSRVKTQTESKSSSLKNSSISKQYQNSLTRANSDRTVVNQHHYEETSTQHHSACSNDNSSSDSCGSSD